MPAGAEGGPAVSVSPRVTTDVEALARRLSDWIREQVTSAGAEGCVVGLSGGVDSAVTAALCARATPGRVLGILMPCRSAAEDEADARAVAEAAGIPTLKVPLDEPYGALVSTLEAAVRQGREAGALRAEAAAPVVAETRGRLASANLKPRLRMMTLYYVANLMNYLVLGTGNRAELEVGYFTKYGDGGVDLLPLGNCTKGDVRALARVLQIPQRVIDRAPTAGLWPGQTDEGEIGLTYDDLDRYLETGSASDDVRARIERLHQASEHKRKPPPAAPRV